MSLPQSPGCQSVCAVSAGRWRRGLWLPWVLALESWRCAAMGGCVVLSAVPPFPAWQGDRVTG